MGSSDDGNLLAKGRLLCVDEDTGGGAVIAQIDLEGFANISNSKEFDSAGQDG